MKLFSRSASPFVRKVRVIARETGLAESIEEIGITSLEEMRSEMPKYNPLGKIPALIMDDGNILYDSKVICEYLDTLHDGEKFFPDDPEERLKTLLLQALGDGIGEAVIGASMEKFMRPEELVFEPAVEFQLGKVSRGLAELESKLDELKGKLTIGPLSAACAIGYLNFRFPDHGWQENNPSLATWYANFCERPSMKDTHFDPPK